MTLVAVWLLRLVGALAVAFGVLGGIGATFGPPRPGGHHLGPVLVLATVFVLQGVALFFTAAHLGARVPHHAASHQPRRHPWIERLEAVAGEAVAVLVAATAAVALTVAFVVTVYSELSMADSVRRARDWMPTPATVEEATLSEWREVRRLTHAHATLRYRYAAEGREFTGSLLLFDGNVKGNEGDIWDRGWLEEEMARLDRARKAGTPVTVFVNPANPSEAVVDPSMAWGQYAMLWFLTWGLGFVPVFGIGALSSFFHDRSVQRFIGFVMLLAAAAVFLIPPAGALLAAFG